MLRIKISYILNIIHIYKKQYRLEDLICEKQFTTDTFVYLKHSYMLAILLVPLWLSGCVVLPFPALDNIDTERLASFQTGVTTKQQIFDILGKPIVSLSEGKVLLFKGTYSNYGLFIIAINGRVGAVDISKEIYKILVKLDDQERIASWQVVKTTTKDDRTPSPPVKKIPQLKEVRYQGRSFRRIIYLHGTDTLAASEINYYRSFIHRKQDNSTILIWRNPLNDVPQKLIDPKFNPFGTFAISRDGSIVAIPKSAEKKRDTDIGIWDVQSNHQISLVEYDRPGWWGSPSFGANSLAISADGIYVAAKHGYFYGDYTLRDIRVWNTNTPNDVATLSDKQWRNLKGSLAFSPAGKMLATTGNPKRLFEIWNPDHDQAYGPVNDSSEVFCSSVAYSDSGNFLAVNCHSHVQIWQVDPNYESPELYLDSLVKIFLIPSYPRGGDYFSYYYFPSQVAFSADEQQIYVLRGAITAWDIKSGKELWRIEPSRVKNGKKRNSIYDFAVTTDGDIAFITSDDGIFVFDLENLIEISE